MDNTKKTFDAKAILFDLEGTLLIKDYSKVGIPDVEIKGAGAFLRKIKEGKWAVVTTINKTTGLERMKKCDLITPGLFIGCEEVTELKPSPQPYQIAADKLGLSPQDCIVFEDSAIGVQSALKAGCRVIQISQFEENPLDDRVEGVIGSWDQVNILHSSSEQVKISISESTYE